MGWALECHMQILVDQHADRIEVSRDQKDWLYDVSEKNSLGIGIEAFIHTLFQQRLSLHSDYTETWAILIQKY